MHKLLLTVTLLGLLWLFRPIQASSNAATCAAPNIIYSTFIGAELTEQVNDIVLDADGSAYLSGTTFSTTFPATSRATDNARHGVDVAGIVLNASGTDLSATYWVNPLNGDLEDYGNAVALDGQGNHYYAGVTASAEFCTALGTNLPGADTSYNGSGDGFLFKVNGSTGAVDYCTFVGGSEPDNVRDIAAMPDGTIYLAGETFSAQGDFPDTQLGDHGGASDAFVTQVTASGAAFANTLLLGGSGNELGRAVALDAAGSTYLTGWTFSGNFPATAGALDGSSNGGADGYVAKVSSGGELQFATYLGGSGTDYAYSIAVDATGRTYVTGGTTSTDFPTSADAYDASHNGGVPFGGFDAFLSVLSSSGAALEYGSFFGGSDEETAFALFQSDDAVYLTGETTSADFPLTSNALDSTLAVDDFGEAFLVKYDTVANVLDYATFWGGAARDFGTAVYVQNEQIYLVGESNSAELCTTAAAYDQTHNGDSDIFVLNFTPDIIPTAATLSAADSQPTVSAQPLLLALLFTLTAALVVARQINRGRQ